MLIAPNAFKGSLTATQAARAFRAGVRQVLPSAKVELMPIADGGDGLIESLLAAKGGRRLRLSVRGPLGGALRSQFAMLSGGTAVIEMALASGLALLPRRDWDVWRASTFGTGQLIKAALSRGARAIVVGLGGSASSDGGAGMAQALGFRLLDSAGCPIAPGAAGLLSLQRIEAGPETDGLRRVRVIGVSDVDNPLLGPRGSARVYGPQKGASPATVRLIERALRRYADRLRRQMGRDIAGVPGAGAAGGLGAGLLAFLKAELVPGAGYVLDFVGARRRLGSVRAALTGEGRLDRTSFFGKAPIEFSKLAASLGVPVAAVCGRCDPAIARRLDSCGIRAVATLEEAAGGDDPMARPARWAAKAAALAIKRLWLACLVTAAVASTVSAAPLDEIDRLYWNRHQGGNLEAGLDLIEGEFAKGPESAELLWRQGRALIKMGEKKEKERERLEFFGKAERAARRAAALDPKSAEARFTLAIALGRSGQTQGMLKSLFLIGSIKEELRAVLELDPKHAGAHHATAQMLMQIPGFAGGDKKKAVLEFEKALALAPDETLHYPALAEAYLAVGEKEKAVEVLKRALEIKEPRDPAQYEKDLRESRELLERLAP
ncbi:MAG: glycerate kinase [Elusimicrobia bacterium]|nr:glycerate kinase [Elusimicrobiota bacterium]